MDHALIVLYQCVLDLDNQLNLSALQIQSPFLFGRFCVARDDDLLFSS